MLERNVKIINDFEGNRIVVISDIRFRGKRKINWDEVESYLKRYVGEYFEIEESADKVYIGTDFPDEYANSMDTMKLRGTLAKAKANAAQGVPELVRIAKNKSWSPNYASKHQADARYGWYRYDAKVALPVYNEEEKIERYNIFSLRMLVRHDKDGKKYLYDMLRIKKETSTPLELD